MMKIKRAILLIAFVSLVATQVSPQQRRAAAIPKDEVLFDEFSYSLLSGIVGWRMAVRGRPQPDGSEKATYYDPDRVTRLRGVKQAWLKTETVQADQLELYWMDLYEFDCTRRRFRVLETHEYNDASVLTESSRPARPDWIRVVPESVGEDLFGVICLNRKDQMRLDMEEAARLFRLGRKAEKARRFNSAIRFYEDALALQPGHKTLNAALQRLRQ